MVFWWINSFRKMSFFLNFFNFSKQPKNLWIFLEKFHININGWLFVLFAISFVSLHWFLSKKSNKITRKRSLLVHLVLWWDTRLPRRAMFCFFFWMLKFTFFQNYTAQFIFHHGFNRLPHTRGVPFQRKRMIFSNWVRNLTGWVCQNALKMKISVFKLIIMQHYQLEFSRKGLNGKNLLERTIE